MPLPFLTTAIPPIDAGFRVSFEDFEVEELPAYTPSGHGEHVFAWIQKRGLTTRGAVRALCDAVGSDPASAGWAGMKDREAVTRQWVSLADTTPEALLRAEVADVTVLHTARHTHKLRPGHLRGNHFSIRLRDLDPARIEDLREVVSELERKGLPNYYGEQRFGRAGDNAERALQWVRDGGRAPRAGFQRKLQMSSLQSALFNQCVAERVQTSTLGEILPGDVVKKHDSGGEFVVEDLAEAQRRADAWEISPTGPLFGPKMRWPEGEARRSEEALLQQLDLTPRHFQRWKRIAAGARRFVRVPVGPIGLRMAERTASLDFTLPAGSYATILVREIRKRDAPSAKSS